MASSTDRLARVILTYEVNRASAQAAANSARNVRDELDAIGAASSKTAVVAGQLDASFSRIGKNASIDKLAAEMSAARQAGAGLDDVIADAVADLERLDAKAADVDRLAHAFDRAEKEARDLAAAEDELLTKNLAQIGVPQQRPSLFQGGRLQGGALGRLGSELRLLPSVQIPGANIGTDQVANLIRLSGAANTVLKSTGASLASVGVAAGLAGGALIAVGLAFAEFNRQAEASKRSLEGALAAQSNYFEALGSLTTRQVEEEVARLSRLQGIQQQAAAEAKRAEESAFQQAQAQFGDAAARALFQTDERFRLLVESSDQADKALAETDHTLARFTQGLEGNQFAANTAREQLERVREALLAIGAIQPPDPERFGDFVVGLIEGIGEIPDQARDLLGAFGKDRTQRNLEGAAQVGDDFLLLQNALSGTAQGARDLAGDYELQAFAADLSRQALQASGDTSLDAADQIKAYNTEAEHARDLADQLRQFLVPLLEAREAEIALIERQIAAIDQRVALEVQAFNVLQTGTVDSVDARIGSLNAETAAISRSIPQLQALARTNVEYEDDLKAAQDRLTALNLELNVLATLRPDVAARQFREESEKLAASLVKDIHRIEAARDSRIAEIEATLGNKEAELAKRRSDDVTEAEDKAAAKRIDALEDFREAEARINRKFNKDYLLAVGNRDALAAFEAKLQREEDLQEAEAKLAKQEAAIDRSLREQQKTIEKRYADQLQTARQNARDAIRLERDKATAEINLKVQAYNTEIAALQQNLFAQFALNQQFWAANIALAQRAVGQVVSQFDAQPRQIIVPNTVQLSGGTPYERFAAYQRDQGVPGFASGLWNVPYDNFVMRAHKGEMVVPERQARVIRERGGSMGGQPTSIRLKLDGAATTRLLEGKAVDVYVAIEGGR
jgi:hypothetical protein